MRVLVAIGVLVALEQEGHTSTFARWEKSLPGMCVSVDLQFGAQGDGGATENQMVRQSKAALDKLAATIAPALQARLARYTATKSPLAGLLAASETAPCIDASRADDPAYAEAQRWSEPLALDTLRALVGDRVPEGVTDWRGVGVRLRLAKPTGELLRAKIANEMIVAQFRGAPLPTADASLKLDWIIGRDFARPERELFAALAVVARERARAATSGAPAIQALLAVLDGKPLPDRAAEAPAPLVIALWSTRDTAQLATWAARFDDRGWFVDARGELLAKYFEAARIAMPPLPGARWKARLVADGADLDRLLADLMKPNVAIADEDVLIQRIYDRWRGRTEYDEYQSVMRVLTQLAFARRRIAIADKLFVQTAQLAATPPAGYTAVSLLRGVFDQLWRTPRPLANATVRALVDEAMKHPDEVAPQAISALLNVTWSIPDRVALVTRLATCASCKATAATSIREADNAERAANR